MRASSQRILVVAVLTALLAGCAAAPRKSPTLTGPASAAPWPQPPPSTQPTFADIQARARRLSPAFPRTMYARRTTIVREGTGALHAAVTILRRNEAAEVLARNHNWLRVQTSDGEGWVHARMLRAARPGEDKETDDLFPPTTVLIVDDFNADEQAVDLAGAGWDARSFGANRRMRPSGLLAIMQARTEISPQQLKAFDAQGGLGN